MPQTRKKFLLRISTVMMVGWALTSCGVASSEDVDTIRAVKQPLCDGSNRPRLRLFQLPGGAIQYLQGVVALEYGRHPLVIDGNCQYWMNADWVGQTEEQPWRTGELDAELERTLDDELDVMHLEAMEPNCLRPADTGQRGPMMELLSDYSRANCETSWGSFAPIWEQLRTRGPELYNRGAVLDGPLRLAAVEDLPPYVFEYSPWPLASSLANYIVPLEIAMQPGTSFSVDDPKDVRLLREMREQSFASAAYNSGVRVVEGDTWATLYMRDALPYEDEQGTLPF